MLNNEPQSSFFNQQSMLILSSVVYLIVAGDVHKIYFEHCSDIQEQSPALVKHATKEIIAYLRRNDIDVSRVIRMSDNCRFAERR